MVAHTDPFSHATMAVVAVAAVALYLFGWVRRVGRRSLRQPAAFCGGVSLFVVVSAPLVESVAEGTFTGHMVQHLALYAIVPPLIVVAHPGAVMAPLAPRTLRRVVHPFGSRSHAALATVCTIAVLYGLHLSPLYDLALANSWIHAGTHVALVTAGLLAWSVALRPGIADGAVRVGFAITSSVPVAILGVALTSASSPLSATYAEALGEGRALTDQRIGGALMWIGAMIAGAALLVTTVWRWASHEQVITERLERLSTGGRGPDHDMITSRVPSGRVSRPGEGSA